MSPLPYAYSISITMSHLSFTFISSPNKNVLLLGKDIFSLYYLFACRTLEYTFKIFFVGEIMPSAAAWVNLDIITQSEVTQRKTKSIYNLHVKSKRVVQINLFIKQK